MAERFNEPWRAANIGVPTLDAHLGLSGPPPGLILVAGTPIAQKSAFVSQWFNVTAHYLHSALFCHYEFSDNLGPAQLHSAFGQYGGQLAKPVARPEQSTDHCAYYLADVQPTVTFDYLRQKLPQFQQVLAERRQTAPRLVIFDTLLQAVRPGLHSGAVIGVDNVRQVHRWAIEQGLTVVATVDLFLPTRQGAKIPEMKFLQSAIGPYVQNCLGAYVLSLNRPELLRVAPVERMQLRFIDPSWSMATSISIDVDFNHERRWFQDPDTQANQRLRAQLTG